MKKFKEGFVSFFAEEEAIVNKKMAVFYNKKREESRTILLSVLHAEEKNNLLVADVLSGSGITGIRILKELPKSKIKKVAINDIRPSAVKAIKKNVLLNKCKQRANVHQQDGNIFLREQKAYDCIFIDPFGTPIYFLESAMKNIKDQGLLIITATDTASLFGAYPASCKRKYWATPTQSSIKKEVGLRIFIRRIQLVAASYEKTAIPIITYVKDHYVQAYFRITHSKKLVQAMLKQHELFSWEHKKQEQRAGPLWTGQLWDKKLLAKIGKEQPFLTILEQESHVESVGFYHLPTLCSELKQTTPPLRNVMNKLKEKKYKAVQSHFAPASIRTTATYNEVKKILKLKNIMKK